MKSTKPQSKPTSFRLSSGFLALLREMAEEERKSQREILEDAIGKRAGLKRMGKQFGTGMLATYEKETAK